MRNICEEKMVDFRLFAAGLGEAGLRSDGTSLGETLFRARLRLVCGHSAAKRKGLRAVGNSDHSGSVRVKFSDLLHHQQRKIMKNVA